MADKKEIERRIKIMQAWVDGSDIQLKDGNCDWEDYKTVQPKFLFDRFEFRIKPQPREIWVDVDGGVFYDKGVAMRNGDNLTKFREVMQNES